MLPAGFFVRPADEKLPRQRRGSRKFYVRRGAYFTRTMQDALLPSQEAVTRVVPDLTPVTLPLPSTVATELSATDQVSAVVTPETFSEKLSPTERVMSVRLREAAPLPEEEAPEPSLLTRTMHTALALPRRTVISVVPFFRPVTTPAELTEAVGKRASFAELFGK